VLRDARGVRPAAGRAGGGLVGRRDPVPRADPAVRDDVAARRLPGRLDRAGARAGGGVLRPDDVRGRRDLRRPVGRRAAARWAHRPGAGRVRRRPPGGGRALADVRVRPMTDAPTTQRTLVLVKPDGVRRGLSGEIVRRIEAKGYTLVAVELREASEELLAEH